MAKEMSAIGNSATASRKDTDLQQGKQMLTEVEITRTDNAGFVVRETYRFERARGVPRATHVIDDDHVEPKTYTFASFADVAKHLHRVFGAATPKAVVRRRQGPPLTLGALSYGLRHGRKATGR
jgi:hypothetical protein